MLRNRLDEVGELRPAAAIERITVDRDERRSCRPAPPDARSGNDNCFVRRSLSRAGLLRISVSRPQNQGAVDKFDAEASSREQAGECHVARHPPASRFGTPTLHQLSRVANTPARNTAIYDKRAAHRLSAAR